MPPKKRLAATQEKIPKFVMSDLPEWAGHGTSPRRRDMKFGPDPETDSSAREFMREFKFSCVMKTILLAIISDQLAIQRKGSTQDTLQLRMNAAINAISGESNIQKFLLSERFYDIYAIGQRIAAIRYGVNAEHEISTSDRDVNSFKDTVIKEYMAVELKRPAHKNPDLLKSLRDLVNANDGILMLLADSDGAVAEDEIRQATAELLACLTRFGIIRAVPPV